MSNSLIFIMKVGRPDGQTQLNAIIIVIIIIMRYIHMLLI